MKEGVLKGASSLCVLDLSSCMRQNEEAVFEGKHAAVLPDKALKKLT